MTKIFTKEIRAAINSLVFFDATNVAHGETQAEYLAKNIRDMRKGAQAVVAGYKGMKGPKRDQWLRDNEVPQIAGRPNTNTRLAWEYLASAAGARMVQRAEKGTAWQGDDHSWCQESRRKNRARQERRRHHQAIAQAAPSWHR